LTTVSAGVVDVQNNTGLGTTAGATTVASGAAIQVDGTGLSIAEPINTLIGTGISSGGALRNLANANTWSGAITLGPGGARINSDAGTLTLTGGVTGTGLALTIGGAGNTTVSTTAIATGAGTVTKDGAGALIMNVANTYAGGTTLNAGTLNINNSQALGTVAGTFTINGGAIDNTSAANITTLNYPLVLNGDFTYPGSVPRNLNLGTGPVTMNGDRQITVSNGTLTIGGTISAGSYDPRKAGVSTLSFGSNAVTLKGLTISAGTLTSTSSTMNLAGDFTNNGTFAHNSGTVSFNGSGAEPGQAISGNVTAFYNLTINGLGGGAGTNSLVVIPTTNTPTVAGTLTNNGTLKQTISVSADTVFLQVTDGSGDKYRGVDILTSSNLGSTIVTVSGNQPSCPNVTLGYYPAKRCYDIDSTTDPGSSNPASVVFYVTSGELRAGQTTATLKLWHYTDSWAEVDKDSYGACSSVSDCWVKGKNITSFSPFILKNFDPTAVTLASFEAAQAPDAAMIVVTWETTTELNNRGFNVWRGATSAGPDVKLNDTLIPSDSQGLPGSGFTYTWEDSKDLVPGTTYYYWLEDLDTNDNLTLHPEPVSVTYDAAPTAVTLNGLSAVPAAIPALGGLAAVALAALGGVALRRRRK
jgi:autotransporter-associated beta strand protein